MTSCKLLSRISLSIVVVFSSTYLATRALAVDANSPFIGRWAFTTPDGGAGWLGITAEKGYYDGGILWVAGSVEPVDSVFIIDGTLHVTRIHDVQRKDAAGKVVRTQRFTDLLMGKVDGDEISLTLFRPSRSDEGMDRQEFTGKRIPAIPPAPDISKVQYNEAITLFNGRNLDGWRLTEPKAANGWSVQNGVLVNNPVQEKGEPHISYGNLRTDREFGDFNLTLETRLPKDGNSGIYLRGIYEVQMADTYGRPLDSHNMGAVYSRIKPTVAAEKPAGEWQTLDITLCKRHVTVVLNGKKIIDNQPLLGCTGGALWSDEMKPGPIYLQGDHAAVEYRNVVLRPIAN
jgi:hypothetical protein